MADRCVGLEEKGNFGRKQLERLGWTEGKGLGKGESGIAKAIKVKIKCDTSGVGYDPSDEYSFHWWDHVFNKAAKNIEVCESQDEIRIVNHKDVLRDAVSKRKPSKDTSKNLLYGRFIKASNDCVECMESDDESGQVKDVSESCSGVGLVKACGGRTAHKAARHGLNFSGKLRRIEEQEKMEWSQPCKRTSLRSSISSEKVVEMQQKQGCTVQSMKKLNTSVNSQEERKERRKRKQKNGGTHLEMDLQAARACGESKHENQYTKSKRRN